MEDPWHENRMQNLLKKKKKKKDYPGGPVAKTPHFQCRRLGFSLWPGN